MKRNLFLLVLVTVFLLGCSSSGSYMLPEPFGNSAWIPSSNTQFSCPVGGQIISVQSEGVCRKMQKGEDQRQSNVSGANTGNKPLYCSVGNRLVPVYREKVCKDLQEKYENDLLKNGVVSLTKKTRQKNIYENRFGGLTEYQWNSLPTDKKCQVDPNRLPWVCQWY